MKRQAFILLAVISIFSGCTKKESTRTSGIDTIDNTTLYSTTYYQYGFYFPGAKLLATTSNPGPDITLFVNDETGTPRLTLQSDNLNPSFFKVGDYADAATAQTAFDNLKTVSVTTWADMADPINANQVWIYKSGTENYTKFRIVSIVNETRQSVAYGECTFQWVYQPNGSSTFPGK